MPNIIDMCGREWQEQRVASVEDATKMVRVLGYPNYWTYRNKMPVVMRIGTEIETITYETKSRRGDPMNHWDFNNPETANHPGYRKIKIVTKYGIVIKRTIED